MLMGKRMYIPNYAGGVRWELLEEGESAYFEDFEIGAGHFV
jgi:hypothetical protein